MPDIWDNVLRDLLPDLELALHLNKITHGVADKVQSPIEHALLATLELSLTLQGFDVRHRRQLDPKYIPPFGGVFIEPQAPVGTYRADLLVGIYWPGAAPELKDCVIVECDGHAWHEKTPEQAARDKARDRFLQGEVFKVIRFTGSEIYRTPGACAAEVWKFMQAAYDNAQEKLPKT